MSATTSAPPELDVPRPTRSRRRWLVGGAAVVVLAAVLTWLIAFSSVFGVRTVQVHGARQLGAREIEAAAGIVDGTPLVRVDTAGITRRIERLAGIASAQVQTSFPSTVVITVEERTPVGYVERGGKAVYVDRTGDQYRTVASPAADLPRFVVPAGVSARTTGGAVATVAAALPKVVRAEVRSIQALDPQAITLVLNDGRTVQWGSAARSADKARDLQVLLHRPRNIDVSDPDQPYLH